MFSPKSVNFYNKFNVIVILSSQMSLPEKEHNSRKIPVKLLSVKDVYSARFRKILREKIVGVTLDRKAFHTLRHSHIRQAPRAGKTEKKIFLLIISCI